MIARNPNLLATLALTQPLALMSEAFASELVGHKQSAELLPGEVVLSLQA